MREWHVAWPYPTFSLFSVLKLSLSVRRFEFLHESIPTDSRSSYNEPAETDGTRRILKYEPSSVLFSSAALKTPFALLFLRPSRASHTAAGDAPHIFKELQKSVALTAERCAEMLHSLVDANPVLNMFASMSSQFHDFCGQFDSDVAGCSGTKQCRIIESPFLSLCLWFECTENTARSQNISFHTSNFAAILPGDSVAGMVVTNGILNFLNIYSTVLVVRLVLTWFLNAPASIVSPLSALCDPYLNIFRGLIPPLGGTLDLSPILAFLVLNAFTSTASAFPAEIPPSVRSQEGPLVQQTHSNYTASLKKWMRSSEETNQRTQAELINRTGILVEAATLNHRNTRSGQHKPDKKVIFLQALIDIISIEVIAGSD